MVCISLNRTRCKKFYNSQILDKKKNQIRDKKIMIIRENSCKNIDKS